MNECSKYFEWNSLRRWWSLREMGDVLMCHNRSYEIACVGNAIKEFFEVFWCSMTALD